MLEGLSVGEQLTRRDVHTRFGGRRQGGIGPSRRASIVLFFTDPATGHRHGYYDGWGNDGLFHYVGEGQHGDQQLTQGNRAILKHREQGRTLEGFRASGTTVTYLGEFELVDHYFTDAHETGNVDVLRQVVVFRLRPEQDVLVVELPRLPITPPSRSIVEVVPVEEQHTERAFVTPDRTPYESERREASLVSRYLLHLQSEGHRVSRLRVIPPGESCPLYNDLWDETSRELIEAKGSVSRDHLRQAVGQLLDYGRFVEAETHAVLVPGRPRDDLLAYLTSAGINTVYSEGEVWVRVLSRR